jgi:hypothetical protein
LKANLKKGKSMNSNLFQQYIGKQVSVSIHTGEDINVYTCTLGDVNDLGVVLRDFTGGTMKTDNFSARFFPWTQINYIDLVAGAGTRSQAA